MKQEKTVNYIASMPAERPSKHPGMSEGISSMICAAISLLFFPPVFGATGIILGLRSKKRGAKTFGIIGMICSAIFMIIGLTLGMNTIMLNEVPIENLSGFMGILLNL